jgi:hypothetical protein
MQAILKDKPVEQFQTAALPEPTDETPLTPGELPPTP